MTPELIATIQSFTLTARRLLEREAEEQLQGLYGWLPDGSFGRGTALALPDAVETRQRLEAYVAEEAEAGVDAAAARTKLKRETAFTWLNRAVAFRLMEERGIIKATFARLLKSNAFIYWLTDVKGEASIPASTPVNALGEGPVDAAYREFLLWQCGQLAAEISVLFDPATLASRLCPRPAVLKELVEAMNAADLVEAWKAGNEETIGWVYQGFSAEELIAAFAAAKADKKKFEPEDIPAVTQLFTIRWVVRFLVENTLGRIWVEMHPDSRMAQSLGYLVPPKHPQHRALRQVKEITFLDPCCGSMHFGLLAFDLFAEMYREERENAGKPGWPEKPSATTEEEIPELILAHNLHGIDIDTRAVQLSALTLVLKARMLNPKARVTDTNLATANIEQLTGGRLDEFISKTAFSHPIYERILRRLADRVKDSPHLGSLLRLEKDIKQLVDAERQRSGELLKELPGIHPEQFDTEQGVEEFFDILTAQILRHLDHFVQATRAEGREAGLFAREAAKGLRFLNLIDQRYDVVTTNPPYLSGRKMNDRLATLLEQEYEAGKGDLYAAFMMRCHEFLASEGLMGMLTMHSFMFISSYEDLRTRLRSEVAIETLAHFGGGLFAVGNPATLQTCAFVFRREPEAVRREGQVGIYIRLVKERDADAKRLAFESSLAALHQAEPHQQVFNYQQSDFDAIPSKPWAYWISAGFRKLFQSLPSLGDQATPRAGMHGGDLFRFGRFWWEVGLGRIGRHITSIQEAFASHKKWFPYMKGGGVWRWYGNQQWVVAFDEPHFRILSDCGNKLPSREYYFKRGVTWTEITSGRFCCRLSPGGFIFDAKGSTCFTDHPLSVLPLMNSRFADYCLQLLNPTISVQAGDIARLPIPADIPDALRVKAERAVILMRSLSQQDETTYELIAPSLGQSIEHALDSLGKTASELHALEREIDFIVDDLYHLSESDRISIQSEVGEVACLSLNDPTALGVAWASYAIGAVLGRFDIGKPGGLGCGDFPEATVAEIRELIDPDGIMPCEEGHAQDIAARAFACLELMLGTVPARDAVRTTTDTEGDPVEALRGWLDRFTGTSDRSFWKYHHQLYRKRPVYWPFQSPQKTFTVWVFQEKLGTNTLHTIKELADVRLNLLERSEIPPLRLAAATNRAKEKELGTLLEKSDDLREFSARLKQHIESGYQSCPDDGVLLNAAPLHDLLPNWPDTKKAWEELKAGKYEWAHQAMRHWPDRVTEACRTNRSFAIAHGLEHLCPAAPPKAARAGRRKKADEPTTL